MAEPKKYSLKPIEAQLLRVIQQQQNALLSNTLSFIAIERLALQVTENTRFELNDDLSEVTVTEDVPEEAAGVIESTSPKKK